MLRSQPAPPTAPGARHARGASRPSSTIQGRQLQELRLGGTPHKPTTLPPTGLNRKLMTEQFDKERYGQRWQAETVFSMIKRNLGSALHGRSYWSQCRDMMLLVLTQNLMILWRAVRAFLRSKPVPFNPWPSRRHCATLAAHNAAVFTTGCFTTSPARRTTIPSTAWSPG